MGMVDVRSEVTRDDMDIIAACAVLERLHLPTGLCNNNSKNISRLRFENDFAARTERKILDAHVSMCQASPACVPRAPNSFLCVEFYRRITVLEAGAWQLAIS